MCESYVPHSVTSVPVGITEVARVQKSQVFARLLQQQIEQRLYQISRLQNLERLA